MEQQYELTIRAHDGAGDGGGVSFGWVTENQVTAAINAVRETLAETKQVSA